MFDFRKQRLYVISTIPSKIDPGIKVLKNKNGIKCTFDLGTPSFTPKKGVPYVVFGVNPGAVVRPVTEVIDYDAFGNDEALDYATELSYSKFDELMTNTEDYVNKRRVTVDDLPYWITVMKNLITRDTELNVEFVGYIYYFDNTYKFVKV